MIESRVADREPKDRASTGHDREELRENVTTTWSKYLVEGRLVIDGLTPNLVLYLVSMGV